MRYRNCVKCSKYIGWVGLAANFALMLMNLFIGLVAGSQALVVGSMYSLKDMATSVFVIVGVTVGRKPLDREHPYGHGKVEYFSAGFEGALIVLAALGIFYEAWPRLLHQHGERLWMWLRVGRRPAKGPQNAAEMAASGTSCSTARMKPHAVKASMSQPR